MSKKLIFLMCFVLVFGIGGTAGAAGWTDVNVVNYSFELDNDGCQVCQHTGVTGMGWTQKGSYIGQDVNCAFPGFCGGCDPCDPQSEGGECNCKMFDASDGVISIYMQTNDIYFYQMLDVNVAAKTMYKLKMDAITFDADVRFTASIIHKPTGAPPKEVASKEIWLEEQVGGDPQWKEYSVVIVIPDGHEAIGDTLGIKFFAHKGADDWRWPFLDYIRVQYKLGTDAWDPNPDDDAINVPLSTSKLSWTPGLWADKHNVYFGTDWADVNNRDISTRIGYLQDNNDANIPGGGPQLDKEYFWVVDEVNDSYVQGPGDPDPGPWPGEIWSFKTNDGKAYGFSPGDGADDVARDVNLSWTPGAAAASHHVYFSTDLADVNSRAQDANQGIQGPNTFDPTPGAGEFLELNETYYWAIDEVNVGVPGSPWKSNVLDFTTKDHVVVEDFDSYVDDAAIKAVWKDYWADPPSENGAEVFRETDVNLVYDGNSMRFAYRNFNTIGPNYVGAEANASIADLEIGPDWTANGVKALVLYFFGDPTNGQDHAYPITVDQMYVAVEDGDGNVGIVLYPDMNDIKEDSLHEWNIALADPCLADVNMTNIAKVYIGFGGTEKTGQSEAGAGESTFQHDTVWFDDIGLYPPRCRTEIAHSAGSFDYDDDCVINYQDLDALAGDDWLASGIGMVNAIEPNDANLVGHWPMDDADPGGPDAKDVLDVSGNDNLGTLSDEDNDPGAKTSAHHTDDRVEGTGALTFDGYDDYIEVPALDINSNTVTISAWVKRDGAQPIYAGIVACHGGDPCDVNDPNAPYTFASLDFGSGGTFGFMDWDTWEINHELSYFWGADTSGSIFEWTFDFHSGLIVPDELWSFVALVVEPAKATLYLDDGTLQAATYYAPHYKELFNGPTRFGDQMQFEDRLFKGAMDDVRIYDYSLTPGEILYLSQGASSSQYVTLPPGRPDADGDNKIDLKDYSIMANNWLEEILWPPQP